MFRFEFFRQRCYLFARRQKPEDQKNLNGVQQQVSDQTVYFPRDASIPFMYFPYYGNKRQPEYRSPFVAVQFKNITVSPRWRVVCDVKAALTPPLTPPPKQKLCGESNSLRVLVSPRLETVDADIIRYGFRNEWDICGLITAPQHNHQGSYAVLEVLKKYGSCEIGFQSLEKLLNLAKMYIKYWKSMEILNGKAIRSIWAGFYWRQSTSLFMQCVK